MTSCSHCRSKPCECAAYAVIVSRRRPTNRPEPLRVRVDDEFVPASRKSDASDDHSRWGRVDSMAFGVLLAAIAFSTCAASVRWLP